MNHSMTASPEVVIAAGDRAAVVQELDKIESVVAAAHRLLAEGRLIDLSALDGRTRALCEAMLTLPVAEAVTLAARLEALLGSLDGLGAALQSRFGDIPVMPSHGSAAAAYASLLKHFP